LRWHLHDLFGDIGVPVGVLDRAVWLDRLARRLAREPQSARVRIAREQIRDIKAQTRRIRALVAELDALVGEYAPQLLAEVGCGPLTAAKLIGEIAGADRFGSDAQLARTAGVAPVPVSSGRSDRHRLDRGGNRQLNLALHRLAVNKARLDPVTAAYLKRKQAEGKSRMEALRCLKRYLARRVYRLLATATQLPAVARREPIHHGRDRRDLIGRESDPFQPRMGRRWKLDCDGISGAHFAAGHDDGHDTSLADQIAFVVAVEDRGH
jgi:transposase